MSGARTAAPTAPPTLSIRLLADDPAHAEVGVNCAPWARGQGLTTAALRLRFGFEGTQRQRLLERGARQDSWVAGLLAGELT